MKEAFQELDTLFLENIAKPKNLPDGTTATCAFIWEDILYIANAGDSRAMIYDRKTRLAEFLTEDHSPDRVSERERIESYGGEVIGGRIKKKSSTKPRLAVARGFGAINYKDGTTLKEKYVSVEPEITVYPITKDTDFLVLATDGLWDKVSGQEVADIIDEKVRYRLDSDDYYEDPGRFLYEICIELARTSHDRKNKDNCSVIIMTFDHKNGINRGIISESSEEVLAVSQSNENEEIVLGVLSSESGSFA
eukprot:TRINITY_DN470_c0_g1_i2.p2 TRINITY_DN470_c0_g1~~TRINITY_DN470_c0_g1_i2.p2  ORF type:complete len:250 (+),score=59.88 TRINITY_DN470_c0_g1_i2:381-1130(+)